MKTLITAVVVFVLMTLLSTPVNSAGAAASFNVDPPDCEGNVCTICHPDGECTIIIVNTPPAIANRAG